VQWAKDGDQEDGKVSYLGWRWENGMVVEWGLYVVYLDATDWATITGEPGSFVPEVPELLADVPFDFGGDPPTVETPTSLSCSYDWSPDGARIVFTLWNLDSDDEKDLWIATPGSDDAELLYSGGFNPNWSSTGKIAFSDSVGGSSGDILTIDPSTGSVATLVTKPVDKKKDQHQHIGGAFWSPQGLNLVYILENTPFTVPSTCDIWRVASNGTGTTSLTPTDSRFTWRPVWRP
jgi:Tol biopolymer transport system component